MADSFLDETLRVAGVDSAPPALLQWAASLARSAPPEAIYRQREGRTTLRFEWEGRAYFLKLHTGVGWREVFKNLLSLRLPVIGARNEYRALRRLHEVQLAVPAIAAFADLGGSHARRQSMIVTRALTGTRSLEDYCADWATSPPAWVTRMRLVRLLAQVVSAMHGAGINHRDCYLCHFHLEVPYEGSADARCYIIDLHRAQLRSAVPDRWREKDLAGLYFSAMDCGLSRRDLLRFIRHYHDGDLRAGLADHARRWQQVQRKGLQLYTRK